MYSTKSAKSVSSSGMTPRTAGNQNTSSNLKDLYRCCTIWYDRYSNQGKGKGEDKSIKVRLKNR